MKFCKDCKHYDGECRSPRFKTEVSRVTGEKYQPYTNPLWERNNNSVGHCGKEAIYFEGTWFYKLKQKIKQLLKGNV